MVLSFYPIYLIIAQELEKQILKDLDIKIILKCGNEKDVPINQRGLDPYVNTIGDYLKKMGYQTSVIGKWHMGTHSKFSPENYGFDYHYGITGAGSLYAPIGKDNIVESKQTWDFCRFHNMASNKILHIRKWKKFNS